MERYKRDFAPVFARREEARTSKAYRLFLKATGQWQGMDPGSVEEVNPSKGLVVAGPTVEEIHKEIMADPAAYAHLAKTAPKVQPVAIERRERLEPKLADEPRDTND